MQVGTSGTRRAGAAALAALLLLTGCFGDDDDETLPSTTTLAVPDADDPVVTVDGASDPETEERAPVSLRLSEGSAVADPADEIAVRDGTVLDDARVDELIARLPEWALPTADQIGFNRPAETLPPPIPGETVEATFPPADDAGGPTTPPPGPLQVLRFQPEGEVDLAPFVSVTFDHPMVELASLDVLDAAEVPVVMTPTVAGRWRWIGTRTLRFEVDPGETDRLPAATEYTVVVPAGTTAVDGSILEEAVTWSYATPAATLTDFVGDDETSLPLEPVFVAVFDQRVDPAAVLAEITLGAGGSPAELRLATTDEVDADPAAAAAVAAALDSRAVAFRAVEPFAPATELTIVVGPGVPSAEGPRTGAETVTYRASTYGAFAVADTECEQGDGCTPGTPFAIRMTNPIDPDAFDAELVDVQPTIPGLRIHVYGDRIELAGATDGRTTYTVTLDGALADTYGQALGDDVELTFEVGRAVRELRGLTREWITVDPTAATPQVSVSTVNHDAVHVTAWGVSPSDLTDFRDWVERRWSDEAAEPPEWTVVLDEDVEVDADDDQWAETPIDLSSAFNQAGSQIVVEVRPTSPVATTDREYWRNQPTVAWVQSTTVGIDAIAGDDQLVIRTTDLTDGRPLGGVPVELLGDGRVATTDEEGIALVELGPDEIVGLYANAGEDTAMLPNEWWGGWQATERSDGGEWYVFDDRGVYRPGETVSVAGWVRRIAWSDDARLMLVGPDTTVAYRAYDPMGNELATGSAPLDALGGFDLTVELPAGANLGQAWIDLELDDGSTQLATSHTFEVQEFRTPEFEVTARSESPGPFLIGEPSVVAVDAEYYAGGPLPGADVDWLVSTSDTTYRPPNHDRYTFGVWQPWWYDTGISAEAGVAYDDCFDCGPTTGDTEYEQFQGVTDAGGTHYLQIDLAGDDSDLPTLVTAEATVFDVDRQAWASRTDLLVHSADRYVGLASDRTFVRRGDPIRIDAIVTDIDGELVGGVDLDVVAGRLDWTYDGGRWTEEVADSQTCSLTSTATEGAEAMRCEFDTEVGGTYRISAVVADGAGRHNRTELTQWVSGGSSPPSRDVELESVTIVPDHEDYAPGDTAELLVQAPFAPAYGLMTVVRNGIVDTEAFEAPDGSAVVEVPIADELIPNIGVQIDMTGAAPRSNDDGTTADEAPLRTAYATGRIDLSIPPVTRALQVTATPADASVEPGADTSVEVAVADADGGPVAGADVAVVVVDEAVLALTGYELADPLDVFYADVPAGVTTTYTRDGVQLARADLAGDDLGAVATTVPAAGDGAVEDSAEESADAGGDTATAAPDASARSSAGAPIDVRSEFGALAVFAPRETTGDDGTVTVAFTLPDNLTRYRVMAVAVDGTDHFGKAESTITARLPLQIRPAAPRFLNFGDVLELPVVVQNLGAQPIEVEVAVQTSNLVLTGARGKLVTVPAGDRVEVRFPATTAEVGTANARIVAVSGDLSDAAEIELPVYTPATAEAFATYGVVDEGAIAQPIIAPTQVFSQFGGLEIGTSSTALQALTDAVIYLDDYPYDSADGYASRIMGIASLRDVLEAFRADGLPSPTELDDQVASDIGALAALQNDDGGWPYWQRGRESIPWVTVQATHALVVANQAGYTVPTATLDLALEHIADIESHVPASYPEPISEMLSAYALYVRGEAGRTDTAKATQLYRDHVDTLGIDAIAWLWPSITDPGIRDEIALTIANAAVETAGAATFATDYGEDAYLVAYSDRRTDGIVLDALITEQPDSDLIPKVVAGLLAHQRNGRWNNAHENAFILIALHEYFVTAESVTPAFVARAWLGELYVSEATFTGRTTDRAATLVPMADVQAAGDTTIVLAKDGDGRLYYRLGLKYAPNDLRLAARDEGFVVEREYEAVDDPADVTRDADGTWHIAAGASVRVTLTMVADARRAHVALVDPLPAGLEAVNPALEVSTTTPPEPDDVQPVDDWARWGWWWSWNWYEHQNLRDDRVEAYTSDLPAGTFEYTYVARATTPGTFVVPPTRAEEIYSPEVFGRSDSARVVVE